MSTNTFSPEVLSNTIFGDIVWDSETGLVYRLTPCCAASAKGTTKGVVCRGCYKKISNFYCEAGCATDRSAAVKMAILMSKEVM